MAPHSPQSQALNPESHHLILASSSPRRRELLEEAGYRFDVMPPAEDVECGVCSDFGPSGLVADLAYRKAAAVAQQLSGDSPLTPNRGSQPTIVVAADTVAECDGFALGKPQDEADARAMLTRLSGREHRVLTGVCLIPLRFREGPGESSATTSNQPASSPQIRVAVTRLKMDALTDAQLQEYVESGAWEGKAGAFGYQDRLGWVHIIEGSESNVVGLPMEMLAEMLADLDSRAKA
jgi:septum formation protein